MSRDAVDLDRPDWAVDPATAAELCGAFIRETLSAAGLEQLVVGLSGGIDSAVAAGLAVRALGADKVRGVMMPYATSSESSITDAVAVAEALGMAVENVEITTMADAFLAAAPGADPIRRGNVMARCRMIVLYDRSARDRSLVLGTGNRTEALLGYTTLFGDSACAMNPVGQLYKTEIRLLSQWLGLPRELLLKAPSADLWAGQTDEQELGFTYAEVDRLLVHLVDQRLGTRQLHALGFAPEMVDKVANRVRRMRFKRVAAPTAAVPGRIDPDGTQADDDRVGDENADWKDGGFH